MLIPGLISERQRNELPKWFTYVDKPLKKGLAPAPNYQLVIEPAGEKDIVISVYTLDAYHVGTYRVRIMAGHIIIDPD